MITSDTTDVNSLVSYINDIKPFHSKLTEVVIEYQANDNMNVAITDKDFMAMQFSSVWQIEEVSDGIQTRYRIPAAVMPRYSEDFHQSTRIGVTDEIPGVPGAYAVPNNAALQVSVNGFLKVLGFDYTVNSDRTVVQFIGNSIPQLNDDVELNWAVMDRVFIGIGNNPIVWQSYTLDYVTEDSCYEIMPFDIEPYDSDSAGLYFNGEGSDELFINPFGYVRVETDTNGGDYYVFDFITPLALNTTFWIRVEQREDYNGWTQTSITDTVTFADVFRFNDTVNAQIVDPNSWQVNTALFGIDIDPDKTGYYDINNYDTVGYDSLAAEYELGYYTLFTINEVAIPDAPQATFTEDFSVTVSQYSFYDSDDFDTETYDGVSIVSSTLNPDSTGTVYLTRPSTTVQIFHDYGYNPIVAVYVNGALFMPLSISYPSLNVVEIDFDEPETGVIRLV
jgi:hypothetical protein